MKVSVTYTVHTYKIFFFTFLLWWTTSCMTLNFCVKEERETQTLKCDLFHRHVTLRILHHIFKTNKSIMNTTKTSFFSIRFPLFYCDHDKKLPVCLSLEKSSYSVSYQQSVHHCSTQILCAILIHVPSWNMFQICMLCYSEKKESVPFWDMLQIGAERTLSYLGLIMWLSIVSSAPTTWALAGF